LTCGVIGTVKSFTMVSAMSDKLLNVIDSLCNSANDVCFTVVGSVGESII